MKKVVMSRMNLDIIIVDGGVDLCFLHLPLETGKSVQIKIFTVAK